MILSNISRDLERVPIIANFARILRDSLVWSKTMLNPNIFQTHFHTNVSSVIQYWGLTKLCIVMFNGVTKTNKVVKLSFSTFDPKL